MPRLFDQAQGEVARLEGVYADEGYAVTPAGVVWRLYGWMFTLVGRLLPKRWVVARR